MAERLEEIRSGRFADHLVEEQSRAYPGLRRWRAGRPEGLARAESRLRKWLRGPGPRK